jgi:hypothetical protein
MGVMDKLFGGADPGTSSTAQPPALTGNPNPSVNNPQTQVAVPANTPVVPATPASVSSPLDAFSNLWSNPVDANGQPLPTPVDPLSTDIFSFDPAKVREQSNQLDFVKDIKPELLERVTAGGADGTAALLELINGVQQNAFAAATLSAGRMVNQGVLKNNVNIRTALPNSIRSAQLQDTPVGDNPVLSHPAVQPLVHALRLTAFNKDPNANPAAVAKTVNDYIIGLTTAMSANSPENLAANTATAAKQTDFRNFFGEK